MFLCSRLHMFADGQKFQMDASSAYDYPYFLDSRTVEELGRLDSW